MRRLYRSNTDRMVAGVCGGIGEYTGLDPTVVRVAWIVFGLLGGIGFVAYIAAWVIIPARRHGVDWRVEDRHPDDRPADAGRGTKILGTILVLVGVVLLIREFGGWWFRFGVLSRLWPVLLIAVGAWMVAQAFRGDH